MTTSALLHPPPALYLDLARWDGWRTEARDARGRWTRITPGAEDLTGADRARGNASLEGFRPVATASDADAAEYLRRTAPKLPASQRDAVTRYSGDTFYRLNRALRDGDASDPEVKRLDAAFRPAAHDMILTRHVDHVTDPQALAGKKLTDRAYASAALGSPYAGGLGGVTLHIAVPKGTPVINAAAVSSNAHEREVILPRGTSLAISRVVPNARYGYDAYAVVLPPEKGALDFAQAAPPPPSQGQSPPQAQQQAPPQQQQDDGLDDAALAVAVAALLTAMLATGAAVAGVAAAVGMLKARFALSHAAVQALGAVLGMVLAQPHPVTGVIGPASEQTSRMNAARRAQYVLAASKRVLGAARQARAKGESVTGAVRQQMARERKFFEQHQAAMWQRATAAGKIDLEAAVHGPLLGWYAKHDKRTTAECLKADRHNFYVTRPPDIGLPGIGPHAGCRCEAGPPWPNGKLLAGSGPRFARAA